MQELRAVDRVRHHSRPLVKGPSVAKHAPVDHRQADQGVEPLQRPDDEGAMRPWAGEADIEVVAVSLRDKTARPTWAGNAVRRDPVVEGAVLADETTAVRAGIIPLVVPDPVDEQSQASPPFLDKS